MVNQYILDQCWLAIILQLFKENNHDYITIKGVQ